MALAQLAFGLSCSGLSATEAMSDGEKKKNREAKKKAQMSYGQNCTCYYLPSIPSLFFQTLLSFSRLAQVQSHLCGEGSGRQETEILAATRPITGARTRGPLEGRMRHHGWSPVLEGPLWGHHEVFRKAKTCVLLPPSAQPHARAIQRFLSV